MVEYYELDIMCTGCAIGGDKFSEFDHIIKEFDTTEDLKTWLLDYYRNAKRSLMYHGNNEPCGYVYEFENADWSHSPVEKWIQRDWVNICKVHFEPIFEEIEHEIPENKKM